MDFVKCINTNYQGTNTNCPEYGIPKQIHPPDDVPDDVWTCGQPGCGQPCQPTAEGTYREEPTPR